MQPKDKRSRHAQSMMLSHDAVDSRNGYMCRSAGYDWSTMHRLANDYLGVYVIPRATPNKELCWAAHIYWRSKCSTVTNSVRSLVDQTRPFILNV